MSNLKQLYFQVRNGLSSDISSYIEAVQNAFNDPADYILNLEYIIQSSTGLETFKPFIEKYGFPIAAYNSTMELLEKCVNKCTTQKKDASLYIEAINYLNEFKEKYHGAFDMFDFYSESDNSEYIKTFYSFTNDKQNRLLVSGMMNKFGEAALPDLIILADQTGCNASAKLESIINNDSRIGDSMYCEWVNYACEGTHIHPDVSINSLSSIIEDFRTRNNDAYQEAVIMGETPIREYTEEEIDAIQKLIKFKEFVLTGMDNSKIDSIMEAQCEIYKLYEELDGIMETDADIVQMLPEGSVADGNTRDKKTSSVPAYIKRNHDISTYGEEEPDDQKKSLDDYRRPSAPKEEDDDKEDDVKVFNDTENDTTSESEPETPNPQVQNGEAEKKAIQNYYYYTYNNSLNKNIKDDHSVHSKDDHSTNDSYNGKKEDDFHTVESSAPWELDLGLDKFIVEATATEVEADKPQSDHPIRTALQDIDRVTTKYQQKAKQGVQNAMMVGRAAMKPYNRTKQWIGNMIANWKDANETNIKEKMADPHSRKNLYNAIKTAITTGALFKAGILMNPLFLFLAITKKVGDNKKSFRIRNEMIGELKTEMGIIDEKIKDADQKGDNKAKYELMRLKNELNKKLLRVGGGKGWSKII